MKAANVEYIVVHCSDSPQGRGDTAETIHQWHLENNWSGIGYHRVILESGVIENGRPLYWVGAHVGRKYNRKSIGICLIGDGVYTFEQYASLNRLITRMKAKFPSAKLVGHCDLDSRKTCPQFDVREWFESYQDAGITQEEIDQLLQG